MALVHSAGLPHREFEPLVEELSDRFRLVLPDLPLHGDSEDRPRHPYTREWVVGGLSGFIREACGPRAGGRGGAAGAGEVGGGAGLGALLWLRPVLPRQLQPWRVVLMPAGLHRRTE